MAELCLKAVCSVFISFSGSCKTNKSDHVYCITPLCHLLLGGCSVANSLPATFCVIQYPHSALLESGWSRLLSSWASHANSTQDDSLCRQTILLFLLSVSAGVLITVALPDVLAPAPPAPLFPDSAHADTPAKAMVTTLLVRTPKRTVKVKFYPILH